MKIIVKTEELKQEILKQSEYIHDFLINKDDVKNLGKDWIIGLDSDKAGILMHLYMTPQIIEVEQQKVMNKEQQELLDEAFKNYLKDLMRDNVSKDDPNYILLSKEEFIKKIKTDDKFSERWGLKIEERELSNDERVKIACKQENGIIPVVPMYGDWDPDKEKMNQFLNENNIPTKLITITYNDKTIESYE